MGAKFIKLSRYEHWSEEPDIMRLNVDKIHYYYAETYCTSEKTGTITGSSVHYADSHFFVLEKPEEIDKLIGNLS